MLIRRGHSCCTIFFLESCFVVSGASTRPCQTTDRGIIDRWSVNNFGEPFNHSQDRIKRSDIFAIGCLPHWTTCGGTSSTSTQWVMPSEQLYIRTQVRLFFCAQCYADIIITPIGQGEVKSLFSYFEVQIECEYL